MHSWWECKLVQPLWKTVWRLLKNLKIEPPYDPAIALLGIYPKDTDVVKRKAICSPMFRAALSTIAKLWKDPRCPSTSDWIKKIYTVEYYSAIRKDEYPHFAPTWLDQEGIMLSEIKSSRERQLSYGFTPMWNGRNSMEDIRRRREK